LIVFGGEHILLNRSAGTSPTLIHDKLIKAMDQALDPRRRVNKDFHDLKDALLIRIPKSTSWRPWRGAILRVRSLQVSSASGTDLEPARPPIRMPIRIKFHTLHKGDHNGQTNVPFL